MTSIHYDSPRLNVETIEVHVSPPTNDLTRRSSEAASAALTGANTCKISSNFAITPLTPVTPAIKGNNEIVESTVKEIKERHHQFTEASNRDEFEKIKTSLNNKKFTSQIIELRALLASFAGLTRDDREKIVDGLTLFDQMMKALEFIDCATQRNPSIKLNMTQIQLVKTILKGADPLHYRRIIKTLGKGGYGEVSEINYEPSDKSSSTNYAMKCSYVLANPKNDKNVKWLNEFRMDSLQNEYQILIQLDHPNVIQPLYFQENCFFMELAEGGSLDRTWKTLEGPQLIHIFTQTVEGLAYINKKGFIHCDVKESNIFLTKELNVKIADLGLSQNCDNFKCNFIDQYEGAFHFPPEYLSGDLDKITDLEQKKQAVLTIDSWGFGLMLFRLFTKTSDVYDKTIPIAPGLLMSKVYGSPQLSKFAMSGVNILQIMGECLESDFTRRPTMAQIKPMLIAQTLEPNKT